MDDFGLHCEPCTFCKDEEAQQRAQAKYQVNAFVLCQTATGWPIDKGLADRDIFHEAGIPWYINRAQISFNEKILVRLAPEDRSDVEKDFDKLCALCDPATQRFIQYLLANGRSKSDFHCGWQTDWDSLYKDGEVWSCECEF